MFQRVKKASGSTHDIVERRQLGNGNLREEELDSVAVAITVGIGYIDCVAVVMFEGWSDVSALFSMCGLSLALFWFLVDKDASARWSQWCPVKI